MNILFLTLAYPSPSENNIYSDLMQEFSGHGHHVYVVCQTERRNGKETEYSSEQGVQVLRVKTGNVTKANVLEKGISTLLLQNQFRYALKKYIGNVPIDLILYSTPPITFANLVEQLKNKYKCNTYLLLKDIFPQNAVDIGMLKKGGLLWRYFRAKERHLYQISDHIGCMSPANVDYVIKHNQDIDRWKVEVCPNSIKPSLPLLNRNVKQNIRLKYGVPEDAVLFVYGGNLGRPQGISFVLEVLEHIRDRTDIYFLIVGSGTEFDRIKHFIDSKYFKNTNLLKYMAKKEFNLILASADVGLIFLDPRFTIPNIPSRLTSYMEASLPVVAATDVNTDLKDIIREADCGLWVESGKLVDFMQAVDSLATDKELRTQMGKNGREYLEENYTVSKTYRLIFSHFMRTEQVEHV